MNSPDFAQDAPILGPESVAPVRDVCHVLARIRGKLVRRLYAPGTEQDVAYLMDLLTDYLAAEEAGMPPGHDWARIRPAEAWSRISQSVGMGDYGDPEQVADRVETALSPHPVPDEWERLELHTEIRRARINLDRWHPTDERGQIARQDLQHALAALLRADRVILAAQADLVAAQERGADLDRALPAKEPMS